MLSKQKQVFLKLLLLIFLPLLLSAQWLETTIYVPDSLCGIHHPQAFTYNETNNTIYVGGAEGSYVIAIDGTTNEKIARIPAGEDIRALCWNSTNNKLYCANYNSDNVTVIDGTTNAVITTIPVGDEPCALVYNPTHNKIYCANASSDNATVIDGATNAVITTIPVGNYPWALVFNPTDNKVYCANFWSDNVTVINGATNAIITTIGVGNGPCAFTWNSAQNRTYVANYYSSSVSVIRDVTGIEEDTEIATPSARNDFVVYPNPAKTFFIIHTNAAVQSVKIYDVLGKLIKTEELAEFTNEKQISLKGINSGIYFLQVNTEDTEFIKKLIVTK